MKNFKEHCFYFADRDGKEMFILAQFDNGRFYFGTSDYLAELELA